MPSSNSDEPDKKRIRFDLHDNHDKQPTSPDPKRHSLPAKQVVQLRFLNTTGDFNDKGAAAPHPPHLTSHPTFLHQIIPDESVLGYQNALYAIYFHLPTLSSWIDYDRVLLPSQPIVNGVAQEPTDVQALLSPFIKAGLCVSRAQFLTASAAPVNLPLETRVAEYDRHGVRYAIYKEKFFSSTSASGALTRREAFHEFHRRMAFLMFVHIDGANFIDDEDPRWEVFVAVELDRADKPARFVGYATTYPFSVLSKREGDNLSFADRIRISQVLVVPVAQRAGHGGQILSAIYADAYRRRAVEVTVEDPGEAFRLLRDVTDLRNAYESGILEASKRVVFEEEKKVVDRMRSSLLLTSNQARRCLEVHQFRNTDRTDEEQYKKYRLWVKRRLFNDNIEVLDRYDKDEKKVKLGEIYSDFEAEYVKSASRVDKFVGPAISDQLRQ